MPEHKQSNASEKKKHTQKLKTFGGVSSTENKIMSLITHL